jgi:hypothetical protein
MFTLTSSGSDYGKIQNDSANKWCLAHTPSFGNTLGTDSFCWTTTELTGNVPLQFTDATTTIAAGTGAGNSPTVSITGGHSNSGQINVTTGTGSPSANATLATITFASTLAQAPACLITPANVATDKLVRNGTSTTDVFVSASSTTTFTLTTGPVGLAASTAYSWWYHCF